MPDYLFKYMDEDDEESVSADMPEYLFKYMDEDYSVTLTNSQIFSMIKHFSNASVLD